MYLQWKYVRSGQGPGLEWTNSSQTVGKTVGLGVIANLLRLDAYSRRAFWCANSHSHQQSEVRIQIPTTHCRKMIINSWSSSPFWGFPTHPKPPRAFHTVAIYTRHPFSLFLFFISHHVIVNTYTQALTPHRGPSRTLTICGLKRMPTHCRAGLVQEHGSTKPTEGVTWICPR